MAVAAVDQVEAAAYRASIRDDTAVMTRWLLDHLGQRITTVGLGLRDASVIRRYARGEVHPPEEREARLRLLYRIARTITDAYDAETARAFLTGSNPQLGDQSPLLMIADEPTEQAAPEVVGAARALLHG